MKHSLRLSIVPIYLVLCLLLGGASAAGIWANMLLQLLAIPIIFWALMVNRHTPMPAAGWQLIAILAAIVLIVLIQLIPLPAALWSALPGREPIVRGYALLDMTLPWLPISLAPSNTIASGLWLLPAIATLLAIICLGHFKSSWIAWGLASVTTAGVLIGAMQITSSDPASSPWYFYQITNRGFATGFFSNANHMATLLVCTIPFLTALFLDARGKGTSTQRASGLFVILAGALTVVVVGIAINSSLAGIGLLVPVLAASFAMIRFAAKGLPRWVVPVIVALAAASIYMVFSAPFGNNLTSQAASQSPLSRYTSFTNSLKAAGDFLPLGSGLGTFVEIYPSYEEPSAVSTTYINHVHSDFIEIALETGLIGLAVLVLFLFWWGWRVITIWRAQTPDPFAKAATIATFAILAHSVVDYPLRTVAISALFAACCALMSEPRVRARRRDRQSVKMRARHLSAD